MCVWGGGGGCYILYVLFILSHSATTVHCALGGGFRVPGIVIIGGGGKCTFQHSLTSYYDSNRLMLF